MNDELFINGTLVPLSESIPFPITYQIADIKNPQQRKGANSKTITIPGTETTLRLMTGVFSLSISKQASTTDNGFFNFDPTVKSTARVYSNGILVFNGVCQLLSAKLNGGVWSFDLTLFSDFINFMNTLDTIKVNELDWSEYDHDLTNLNVQNSWGGQIEINALTTPNQTLGQWDGLGYYYGLIDYGFTRVNASTFRIEEIAPQIFSYDIIKKTFEAVGITIESTFLESDFYKKILCAWEGGQLPIVTLADRANQSVTTLEENSITGGFSIVGHFPIFPYYNQADEGTPNEGRLYYWITANSALIASVFNPMNIGVVTDPSSQLTNDYPFTVTLLNDGIYDFLYSGTLEFNAKIVDNQGTEALIYSEGFMTYDFYIVLKKNNVVIDTILISEFYTAVAGDPRQQFIAFDIQRPLELKSSDVIDVQLRITNKPIQGSFFPDGTGLSGSTSFFTDYTISINGPQPTVDIQKTDTSFVPGQNVSLRYFAPSMSCSEYLKGIFKQWNLHVMPDPNDDKLLYIEPLEDFYKPSNDAEDWTQLVDYSKTFEIIPTASIASKSYFLGFKDDKDEFNERYLNDTALQYGSKKIQSGIDFSQSELQTILPFSNKPICLIPTTDLIVPRSYQIKDLLIAPKKGTPFHVLIGATSLGTFPAAWTLIDEVPANVPFVNYPYVGHLDNHITPTFDMNFGVPEFVFYTAASYTSNNLYTYHERFILEVVDRYGKILKASFNLTKADINQLDMSILKNIDGVIFRLQKVNNYDPTKNDASTLCELIKFVETQKGKTGSPTVPEGN